MKENHLPNCNWCKGNNKSEWGFFYGETPSDGYSFCCTEHIPNLIKNINESKSGEVKFGYLRKWNAQGEYDEGWRKSWAKRFREEVGIK